MTFLLRKLKVLRIVYFKHSGGFVGNTETGNMETLDIQIIATDVKRFLQAKELGMYSNAMVYQTIIAELETD